MRSEKFVAARPIGPGDLLRKRILGAEFGGKKITQDRLAKALAVSRLSVNQIINGRRSITADMALRLAHVLGTTPEFWLNLQRDIDLYEARIGLGKELERLEVLRPSKVILKSA
jgi:addiction module HigA family antidote